MGFPASSSTACMLFLFLLLLLLPLSAVAQSKNGRVDVGASLTATNDATPWLSPFGDFAFGFHQHDNADGFLVSIWFDKIPGETKTLVWYAFGNRSPVVAPPGSRIQLTAEDGLVLSNPRGQQLWKSNITLGEAGYAVMNDTGNFQIRSPNSDMLWQSFDQPTDTLLPTQMMERSGRLFSRQSENNFSQGRFQLNLQNDGNLVFGAVNLPTNLVYVPYYSTGAADAANESNTGDRLIFDESGDVYVLKKNRERVYLQSGAILPTPAADFYQRATLDFDGVFAQYYYQKRSAGEDRNWSTVWSVPDNICSRAGNIGSGACGFNSICSLNDNRRPTCTCPPGFSLLDPDDKYGDCKRDVELSCRDDGPTPKEDLYDFKVLINTNWSTSDYEQFKTYNEQDCLASCLHDCMCAVAIFSGDSCWKKTLPLSNGREDSSVNGKAFIKVNKGEPSLTPPVPDIPDRVDEKKQDTLIITGSVLLGTSVFVNLALVAAFCLGFFSIYQKRSSKTNQVGLETKLPVFTYKELAEATNDFKEELGRGAFGIVYKGTIGTASVAVKKLDRVVREGDGHKEFKTEIGVIGHTHHKNLVKLLGICEEGEQRLLVYEFLSNGSLADYLFQNTKPSWNQRTQIAIAIARGLLYLHEECSTQIIHCDIKPQNILLDDCYNARISDFGLSKLLMMDQTHTNTAIRGTKGYVAPEWFRSLPITAKVDVYSFGVLLLEIICCRRNVVQEENVDTRGDELILTYWAYDCFNEGAMDALIGDDKEAINNRESLERLLMTALWCIQEDPCQRPAMRKVTQMLEGAVQVTVPPNPSPFSISAP